METATNLLKNDFEMWKSWKCIKMARKVVCSRKKFDIFVQMGFEDKCRLQGQGQKWGGEVK